MNQFKRSKVLVWPGLTELGYEIIASLTPLRFYAVYSASSKEVSLETHISNRHFLIPNIPDLDVLPRLLDVIKENNIDVIYPAHDDVIVFCREHAKELEGVTIIAPPTDLAKTLRSKHNTYKELSNKISVPKVYRSPVEVPAYPVFAKPDKGQGSQGVRKISDQAELEILHDQDPDYFVTNVVAEFLPGEEYTIDCLSDSEGNLVFSAARMRHQIRNGISTDAEVIEHPALAQAAHVIADHLKLIGAWFFQMKESGTGELKLLEVAPRLGGASCLNRMRGVNFSHLSILAATGKPFSVMPRDEPRRIQRRLANYPIQRLENLDALYLDFDDCLWMDPYLNTQLLAAAYRHQGFGARIVMVSRHASDLDVRLKSLRIHALFDKIYHITDPSIPKSKIIGDDIAREFPQKEINAVFVDDSYRERLDVKSTLGMESLDLTMIETLG